MYSTYFILVPWCSYGQTLANETLNLKCSTDYETMKYDTISYTCSLRRQICYEHLQEAMKKVLLMLYYCEKKYAINAKLSDEEQHNTATHFSYYIVHIQRCWLTIYDLLLLIVTNGATREEMPLFVFLTQGCFLFYMIRIKHNIILFKEHRLCNLGRSLLSYTRAGNKNKNKNNNNTNNNTNNGNSNKASCAHHRHQRLQYSISGHCSICFSFLFFFLHFVFKAFVMKC
uniref:Uncharacterized protein n=1 Tax=Glossina palpalis gambiensis TaxID=67801 RepID=A0A1B0AZL0_9MUSC